MSLGWRGGVFSSHDYHILRLSASTCSKLVFLAFIGVLYWIFGFCKELFPSIWYCVGDFFRVEMRMRSTKVIERCSSF